MRGCGGLAALLATLACSDPDRDGDTGGSGGVDGSGTDTGSSGTTATTASSTATSAGTTAAMDSSSDGGDSSGSSTGGASTDASSGGAALSFELDVWPLLVLVRDPPLSGETDSCNGCHAGGSGGLATPDVATAYANLLDTPGSSTLCADLVRVVPGEPDQSCFVVFYEQRLRDSLGWVDMQETELVRAWVEQGAAP